MIIGPSGSGKTTLLRAVNCLNEEFAGCSNSGRTDRGPGRMVDIYLTAPEQVQARGRMVFSRPMCSLYPFGKPARPSQGHAFPQPLSALNAEQALKGRALGRGLRPAGRQCAHTSGGQQQPTLARVLALSPRILLLDEPTASLDVRSAAKIEELLMKLKERYTILAVSHSIRQVKRIADRAVILSAGQMIKTLERKQLETPGLLEELVDEIF